MLLTLTAVASHPVGTDTKTPFSPMDLRYKELPMCKEQTVVAHYRIDQPPACDGLNSKESRTFIGDIFNPPPTQILVKAVACSIRKDSASYTTYFFYGQSTQDEKTEFYPPSQSDCRLWTRQHRSRFGRLVRSNQESNTLTTRNPLKPNFAWHGTNYESQRNAILTETTLAFNTHSGLAQHVVETIQSCATHEGWCRSERSLYDFPPFNLTCTTIRSAIKQNTTIIHHTSASSSFFQIPDVDIAFSDLVECPESIKRCFSDYRFVKCTLALYIVASNDASAESTAGHILYNQTTSFTTNDVFKLTLAQSLSSLAINLDYEIDMLRSEMIRFACLSTRIQLINLRAAQYLTPSAVLSTLLRRQAYATIGVSTLQEISCTNVSAVLHPTLWVGERFSARPILSIYFNNKTELAQWTREGYLRHGLKEFTTPQRGLTIFQINGETIIFRNGSIEKNNFPLIQAIGIDNSFADIPQERPDPSLFLERITFTPSPLSLEYLQQSFQSLFELNSAQLSAYGIKDQQIHAFTHKPSFSTTTPQILELISDKINPTQSIVTTVYSWASKVWTTAATALLCYAMIAFINRTIRRALLPHSTKVQQETAANPTAGSKA